MKRVLHVLSSPIIRANGIVTFIRESTAIMRAVGIQVDFMTDATVDYDISRHFDTYYTDPSPYNYTPLERDENKELIIEFEPKITERIRKIYDNIDKNYDLIICHDAQATDALMTQPNCVYFAHTAGLGFGVNLSCLSDDYIKRELKLMHQVPVGVQHQQVADNIGAGYKFKILPLALNNYEDYLKQSTDDAKGVLFLGEDSDRKGADIFAATVRPENARVIAYENAEKYLKDFETHSFDDNQIAEKIEFIRQSRYCYFPSRSDVFFPYSIIEAALSQPVVVNDEGWTKNLEQFGIFRHPPTDAEVKAYDPIKVINYLKEAKEIWKNVV